MVDGNKIPVILSGLAIFVYGLGIINAAHAVMNVRSSRGAIAWSISLITFPWLTLPLYWILGRRKFQGYAEALRSAYLQHYELVHQAYYATAQYQVTLPPELATLQTLADRFTPLAFTAGNTTQLLIDGPPTFQAMLDAIAAAQDYILLQFYIVRDDTLGNQFRQALIQKAQAGVRIYFLYDEIGCQGLPKAYWRSLQEQGVQVSAFNTTKGPGNRLQLNFRNHRKILIVDGQVGFLGGFNIGDEYLGKDRRLGPWRDTHLAIHGAAVKTLQMVFMRDWYWATCKVPEVSWQTAVDPNQHETLLILPTGPADSLPACTLFFMNLINQARDRLWIATPYFVPDDSILTALKLAAIRGVDVRILLPDRPDHLMVYLCSFSYYAEMEAANVKLYRYKEGFMHQKVILVDHMLAGVGTVNLDNRSFFLNFEATVFGIHPSFICRVEEMLSQDLNLSYEVKLSDYTNRSFWFRLMVRIARLLTPVL